MRPRIITSDEKVGHDPEALVNDVPKVVAIVVTGADCREDQNRLWASSTVLGSEWASVVVDDSLKQSK